MGNAAGSVEAPAGKEGKAALAPPGSTGQTKGVKLPMPPEEELEQRFNTVLVSLGCQLPRRRRAAEGEQQTETKNSEYVGNVHVLRTSLSQCQVHNATVERYIRGPLCWSLLQH